jgi:hypothetical protein
MDEAAANALWFANDIGAQPPLRHFLKQNADLQFGKARANATVDAIAE